MTRTVYIVRHAQSAGKQANQRDYDRELTREGEMTARGLGRQMRGQKYFPDIIISSAAVRTRQTVEKINESLSLISDKIQFYPDLYQANEANWIGHLKDLDHSIRSVMIVGHNPCISILTSRWAGRVIDMKPCELFGFVFETESWKNIDTSAKTYLRIQPKDLTNVA